MPLLIRKLIKKKPLHTQFFSPEYTLLLFDNQQTESATQHSTQASLISVCQTGMSYVLISFLFVELELMLTDHDQNDTYRILLKRSTVLYPKCTWETLKAQYAFED